MTQVAVLGLGTMGAGMAQCLLRAGFALTVYNRSPEKAEPLRAAGAAVAGTPAQAVANADVVISMVGDDVASRAVWTGDDGALSHVKAGAAIIEASTLSLEWVRELAKLAAARSVDFLDVPVSGSRDAAANGKLRLYVGGEQTAFERVRPVLNAYGSIIHYMGGIGTGAATKLVMNSQIAAHLAALADGLRLARELGIDLREIAPILTDGAMGSPIVKGKLNAILAQDFSDAHFKLRWMLKNVAYALEASDLDLSVLSAVYDAYEQAARAGFGDLDFAAIASEGLQ